MEGEFSLDDADAWLANLADNDANDCLHDMVETTGSLPTSLATDTRTAQGAVHRGCTCPLHREIYNDWPTHDADLTIASCMKICVYCGTEFPRPAELRRHMKKTEYARRNIRIFYEKSGKASSSTLAWSPRYQTENLTHRSDSEPLTRLVDARTTRSQSLTNSTTGQPRLW